MSAHAGGPAPRPPEAHHCPVTMSAPGRRASHLQVVVTQARRPSRNGGKLVAEAHQSHHDSMLVQYHGGLRGRSAHGAQARGRTLGCSLLCISVFSSISLLFDYMCMRLPFRPWSIAAVPSSQALPGFLITAHHL